MLWDQPPDAFARLVQELTHPAPRLSDTFVRLAAWESRDVREAASQSVGDTMRKRKLPATSDVQHVAISVVDANRSVEEAMSSSALDPVDPPPYKGAAEQDSKDNASGGDHLLEPLVGSEGEVGSAAAFSDDHEGEGAQTSTPQLAETDVALLTATRPLLHERDAGEEERAASCREGVLALLSLAETQMSTGCALLLLESVGEEGLVCVCQLTAHPECSSRGAGAFIQVRSISETLLD